MKESGMSAAQKAAVERIKVMMKEYALISGPSFLYTRDEMLRNIKRDLSKLDEEYVKKYKIPDNVVKNLARDIYDTLMEKGEHDRAITVADHYKL